MEFGRFVYKSVVYMVMGAVIGAAVGVTVAAKEIRERSA